MPNRKAILVVGQNLFFLPRIQNVAGPSGYEVRLTDSAPTFWNLYDEGEVALVLVDLEGDKNTWASVIRGLRERASPVSRVVAFGPHADAATLEVARELGCDAVLTKGEFSDALRKIVETEGAEVKA